MKPNDSAIQRVAPMLANASDLFRSVAQWMRDHGSQELTISVYENKVTVKRTDTFRTTL